MRLTVQKRLAARLLKASEKRVKFDPDRLDEIKESITKVDIRGLVKDKAIWAVQKKGISRGRVYKRKHGHGSRKGKKTARTPKKITWMRKIRLQRRFIKELHDKGMIVNKAYRELYLKSKGGFFRSKRHIKIYIEEHKLIQEKAKK
jgi:large subunit ribosomal protein L19e